MNQKMARSFLAGICLISILFTGCGGKAEKTQQSEEGQIIQVQTAGTENNNNGTAHTVQNPEEEGTDARENESTHANTGDLMIDASILLKIVDGAETGNLVLAGEGSNEVYSLSVGDIPVYLDGVPAKADVLEDGMTAELSYSGVVLETWPAQLGGVTQISVYSRGTENNPGGTAYDLCGLYLKVLNDLWNIDSVLNEGITYISVDLADASGGLTEGEKQAIAWIFSCQHNGEMLTLSYPELVDQGFCEELNWEDGILFRISDSSSESEIYSLPVIQFAAEKWRSGNGAYFFQDCQAVWPEMGTWSEYTVGAEAIS